MATGLIVLVAVISSADASETAEARTLVRNAKAAFDAGQFDQAATLLDQAASLAPTAATLYNLGRAREKAGQLEGAVTAYRRYLEVAGSTKDRGGVEATLDDLSRRIEQKKRLQTLEQQPPQIVEVPVPVASSVRFGTVAPWVPFAIGLAGIGLGIGFGISANNLHARAVTSAETDVGTALPDQARAQSQAMWANIGYVSGAIVAALSLAWFIIEVAVVGP